MEFLSYPPYLVIVSLVLSLNVLASIVILTKNVVEPQQKRIQLAGVWFIPLFAAIGILSYYHGHKNTSKRKAISKAAQPSGQFS